MEGSQGGSLEQTATEVTADNQGAKDGVQGSQDQRKKAASEQDQSPSPYKGTKHRVQGMEEEVDYDELVRGYGHKAAANKRFQEASELIKNFQKEFEPIKLKAERAERLEGIVRKLLNPEEFFDMGKQLGIDVEDLAHKLVHAKMLESHEMERDPDGYKLRRENAELKKKWESVEQKQQREADERESMLAASKVEDEFMDFVGKNNIALDAATKPIVEEAIVVALAERANGRRPSLEQCYRHVEAKHQKAREAWYQGRLKEDVTNGKIPPELQKVFRQKDVQALRRQTPPQLQSADAPIVPRGKVITTDDWFSQKEKQFHKRG